MSFVDKVEKQDKKNKTSSNASNTTVVSGISTSGNHGWICPVCGRGVAPGVSYCNCRSYVYSPYPYPYPWWYHVTCGTTISGNESPTAINTNTYTTGNTTASTAGYINNFGINPDTKERNMNGK